MIQDNFLSGTNSLAGRLVSTLPPTHICCLNFTDCVGVSRQCRKGHRTPNLIAQEHEKDSKLSKFLHIAVTVVRGCSRHCCIRLRTKCDFCVLTSRTVFLPLHVPDVENSTMCSTYIPSDHSTTSLHNGTKSVVAPIRKSLAHNKVRFVSAALDIFLHVKATSRNRSTEKSQSA